MTMDNHAACYAAFQSKDSRFDGHFFGIHFAKEKVNEKGLLEDAATTKHERNIKTMFDAKMKGLSCSRRSHEQEVILCLLGTENDVVQYIIVMSG